VVAISLCGSLVGFGLGGLCGWIGKLLLYKMLRIMFSSVLYLPSYKLCFSLLYRNLIAAYLCWAEWFEVYGMMVSVNVGFLYNLLCVTHGKSDWRILLYIIISGKVHRQLCWYIESVNIVFTVVYAVFVMVITH
jgi:hypothetical protein